MYLEMIAKVYGQHFQQCFQVEELTYIYSEDYQYLAGEVGRALFKEAKKFMCDCCRQKLFRRQDLVVLPFIFKITLITY